MTTAEWWNETGELYCATCERQFVEGPLCPNDGTTLVRLTAASDPLLGRELDGRFTIIEKLGQGGMGAVYRARQHSVSREVAVKVLSSALVSDATSIKRFLREAKLASRLAHPNVVSVLDFGQTPDGVFYLVMELVEGQTLDEVLRREGPLPLPRILRIATQICDALDGAHALPIVHRDLKPANVMVLTSSRDLVKVLDFGLAKSLSTDNTGGMVTSAGALLGTPAFMPPEVAKGLAADERADLYSLGCMIYMMGTGRPPFMTESVMEMIALHGSQPAPPMTGVPEEIAAVVDRLLQKDPDVRYQTAAALRSALEDAYEITRASRPIAEASSSGDPVTATVSDKAPAEPRALLERRDGTTPDHDADTIPVPEAPSTRAMPNVPPDRRAWRRWGMLVVIMFGVTLAGAAVLDRLALLPDPDRPEGGPMIKQPLPSQPPPPGSSTLPPPPSQQPPPPPSQPPPPASPSQPASSPTVERALPSPRPPRTPASNRIMSSPATKQRGERPSRHGLEHKKPGTATNSITVPAPSETKLRLPSLPALEPTGTGSGSSVRPGTGSNAPF